jgi:hypothetical protein
VNRAEHSFIFRPVAFGNQYTAGEQREDRPRRDDVVEVADDVVGVVQVDVRRREAERQAR